MSDFTKQLKQANLKVTKARLGVLEILESQQQPSDVSQVLELLKSKGINADQATVYRILEKLVEIKLVKTVNFEDGRMRYELDDNHHHHLVCVNCKRVESFDECQVDELGQRIKQTHQFDVQKHSLEFFGVCARCK